MNYDELIAKKNTVISVIEMEGLCKSDILKKLADSAIGLNDHARKLFNSDGFYTTKRCTVKIIACSLSDIGLTFGGNFESICHAIQSVGLSYCPVDLAPYVRLAYTDQTPSEIHTVHQNPHGSVTIFSKPLSKDENFPKGFYLRNYDGRLWLRGYSCSDDYDWQPSDRMIFQIQKI